MRYFFRRGFIYRVECDLQSWCGGACGNDCWPLYGVYVVSEGGRSPGVGPSKCCPVCHGAGRIEGHGPALVRACPLEEMRLTDKIPYLTFTHYWGWSRLEQRRDEGARTFLPPAIYDLLPEPDEIAPPVGLWRTEQRAYAALSAACLAWARQCNLGATTATASA